MSKYVLFIQGQKYPFSLIFFPQKYFLYLTKKIRKPLRADVSRGHIVVFSVSEVVLSLHRRRRRRQVVVFSVLSLHEAVDGVVVSVVAVRVLQVRRHALSERAFLKLTWKPKTKSNQFNYLKLHWILATIKRHGLNVDAHSKARKGEVRGRIVHHRVNKTKNPQFNFSQH